MNLNLSRLFVHFLEFRHILQTSKIQVVEIHQSMEVRMQFWNRFESLCQENGEKPTPLVKKLGIPAGSVTSWKNGSVPHHGTLLKIADYFGVTVDYLLGNEEKEKALPSPAQSLNETEAELVKAFRAAAPETQDAVLRVLQIDTGRTQRKDA